MDICVPLGGRQGGLAQHIYGMLHAAQGLFLAEEGREFVHIRSLACADKGDAPCVPRFDACLFHPRVNNSLLAFHAPVADGFQHCLHLAHHVCRTLVPVLANKFVALPVKVCGSHEEELGQRPKVTGEGDVALPGVALLICHFDDLRLHHTHHFSLLFGSGCNTILLQHLVEGRTPVGVGTLQEILAVEPFCFHEVKLGSILRALGDVEQVDHLVQCHQFLIVARTPSQQSQEVDDGFG